VSTLHETIQATLAPTVAGGATYGINSFELNENIAFPYIVWMKPSSPTNNTLAGASALQNTRVQVDLYSDTVQNLEAAAAIVIAAMAAGPFTSTQLTTRDAYEDQVRAFKRSIDFSVWSTNP